VQLPQLLPEVSITRTLPSTSLNKLQLHLVPQRAPYQHRQTRPVQSTPLHHTRRRVSLLVRLSGLQLEGHYFSLLYSLQGSVSSDVTDANSLRQVQPSTILPLTILRCHNPQIVSTLIMFRRRHGTNYKQIPYLYLRSFQATTIKNILATRKRR
jgi:hypothetical protein